VPLNNFLFLSTATSLRQLFGDPCGCVLHVRFGYNQNQKQLLFSDHVILPFSFGLISQRKSTHALHKGKSARTPEHNLQSGSCIHSHAHLQWPWVTFCRYERADNLQYISAQCYFLRSLACVHATALREEQGVMNRVVDEGFDSNCMSNETAFTSQNYIILLPALHHSVFVQYVFKHYVIFSTSPNTQHHIFSRNTYFVTKTISSSPYRLQTPPHQSTRHLDVIGTQLNHTTSHWE
jgi:hypothetical protein